MTLTASEQQLQHFVHQQRTQPAYNIDGYIEDTPQVIHWLRAKTEEQNRTDNTPIAKPADESKPPVNVDLIDSADLEIRALAFWCDHFNIEPAGDFHRVNGQIVGLATPPLESFRVTAEFPKPWHLCKTCVTEWLPMQVDQCDSCLNRSKVGLPDYLQPVIDMVTYLRSALRHNMPPPGMYDDPDYGIERVRKRNFRRWPQMGTVFVSNRVEEAAIAAAEEEYRRMQLRYSGLDENQMQLGEW